jgi:hypothetical protein
MKTLIQSFVWVSMIAAGSAQAGSTARDYALECEVRKSADRILDVRVEPTDLTGQIAATTTILNPDNTIQRIQLVSNGDIRDDQIYLFETDVPKVGTTYRYLEKIDGQYSITQYFRCDSSTGSSYCRPNSDNLRYQGKSGQLSCKFMNH